MIIDKEIQDIRLTLLHQNEQVFSGNLNELPNFIDGDQKADRVKLYDASGSAVAVMAYKDLKKLLDEENVYQNA